NLPAKDKVGPYGYNLYNLDAGFVPPEEVPPPPPRTVLRTVSGAAWYDGNGNGIREAGEIFVAGAVVTLQGKDGNPAKNAAGEAVSPQTTGADGAYLFTNLAAGDFYVSFAGSAAFAIGRYGVSPKDRGDGDTIDSDVTGVRENGILVSARTDDFNLPPDEAVDPEEGYHRRHLDAGFVPPSDSPPPGGGDPPPPPPGEDPSTEPGEGENPNEREEPTVPETPGRNVVPGENGVYIELDENGIPLGEWRWDEPTQQWIFDEYPPLADLPQTGGVLSFQGIAYLWVFPLLSLLWFGFVWPGLRRRADRRAR
ncbi:MAG: hypothetical protein LBB57_02140, partial [Clostridiales Family XIII bacterium]|nr:hypothetical protein [Clostridiales Family XIII bacterium]